MGGIASNDAELRNMIIPAFQSITNDMMTDVLVKNRKEVESTVYSSAWEYATGEFKEAWDTTQESIGDAGSGFDYDPSQINVIDPPVHAAVADGNGFSRGDSSAEYLADLIYLGHGGIWHKRGRNAFNKVDKWFNEGKVRKLFKRGLKANGFKVTVEGGASKSVF